MIGAEKTLTTNLRRNVAFVYGLILIVAVLMAPAAMAALKVPAVVHFGKVGLDKPLAPGATSTLIIDATVDTGWHINSNHPPNADYIPTRINLTLPKGVSASEVQYPAAEKTRLAFSSEELSVFTGDVQFRVPLKSDAGVSATDSLTVTLDYQACNNNQCLAPTSISNVVGVSNVYEVGASTPVAVAAESTVPQSSDWLSRTFSRRGNAIGFLLVLLGGLALNLTPCVYPLIGVTIAYFGNQGGGPRRVLSLAILFVLGIAIMFSSVGVAVALSGGLFGAAMQNPLCALGSRRDDAGAGGLEFRIFCHPAAAVHGAMGGRGATRLRRLISDGPRNGSGRGPMHRTDRAGAAADGGAQRQSAVRLRALLHPRGRTRSAVRRPSDGGRKYPAAATLRRMAGVGRATIWIHPGRPCDLFP